MAEARTYSGNGLTATIADPDNITRDECLALARCGADAWNLWRNTFPVIHLGIDNQRNISNFSRIDFRSNSISFPKFHLGDYANFSESTFNENCNFIECIFGNEVNFSKAIFEYCGSFSRAIFGHSANFSGAIFEEAGAEFECTQFGEWVNFCGTVFIGRANFQGAIFGDFAFFFGSTFNGAADFSCAVFGSNAGFMGATQDDFNGRFRKYAPASKDLERPLNIYPKEFHFCCFDGCTFEGSVNFSDRTFLGPGSFSTLSNELRLVRLHAAKGVDESQKWVDAEVKEVVFPKGQSTQFGEPPLFHGCRLHQGFNFDGAAFPHPNGNDESIRAYRTLKLAFSQQQATRDEQYFFKLEMAEEALAATGWKRWLYRAYEVASDFGFSIRRPLINLLLLPALVASFLYLWCMTTEHPELLNSALTSNPKLASQWVQFIFINLTPLPDSGLLKELRAALFGSGSFAALAAVVLETVQKLLAFVGYFLVGLALRNLFKMK